MSQLPKVDYHRDLIPLMEELTPEQQWEVLEFAKFKRTSARNGQDRWFWSMIDRLDLNAATAETTVSPLIEHLATLEDGDVFAFEDILSDHLKALDTPRHYEVATSGIAGSADGFLYARCEVIANGEQFYHDALTSPGKFLADGSFEELLNVAEEAFKLKHPGNQYNHVPRSNYETRWNEAAWEEKAIRFVRA